MFPKKLRAIFAIALLVIVLFGVSVLLLNFLIQNPSFQSYLLDRLSSAIKYELHTGKMHISLWGGIGITARDLEAKSETGPEKIVAERIRITLDARALLRGRIIPTNIFLFQPHIELAVAKAWRPSEPGESSVLKKILRQRLSGLVSVSMKKGRVSLKNLPFELGDLNLDVSQETDHPLTLRISLKGKFLFKKEKVPFTLRGTIANYAGSKGDPLAEATIKTGKIPLTWIPWPASISVTKGHAEASIKLKGTPYGPVSAEGKITMEGLHFLLVRPKAGKVFSLANLTLDFRSLYAQPTFEISTLRVSGPGFSLRAQSKLDFSESSNPHLELRAESPFMSIETFKEIFPSPVLPLKIRDRLFPVLTNGEVRLDLLSLNGTFKQIKNVALPENAESISMRLTWKNLEVLIDKGALPFRGVSAKMGIEKGELLLSDVKARFGKSTVKTITLNIKNLFGGRTAYDISVDGFFDIGDLLRQRETDIIPLDVRQHLHRFESASGNMEARISVAYKNGWKYPRINKGDFLFRDCTITHKELFFPLLLGEAEIRADGEGECQFRGTGLWGNSIFEAAGSAKTSFETVRARVAARGDINEIMGRFYNWDPSLVKLNGLVPCRISVSKDEGIWSFQGEVDPQGVVLETESFSINLQGQEDKIQFSMDLQPREKFYLRRLSCLFGNSSLELSGSYDLQQKDLAHFKITTQSLLLEDLGIQFKKGITRAKGILVCDTEVKASRLNPLMTVVHGNIEARDLSFVSSTIPSPIHDCNFQLAFSGRETSIRSFRMNLGQSILNIQGNLIGWDGLKGKMAVNADYLNIQDFISRGSKKGLLGGKNSKNLSFTSKTDIGLTLYANRGRWNALEYGPLKAEGAFRSGAFYISRSKVQTDHGVLRVKGYLKKGKDPEMSFSGDVKMTAQPLQGLLDSLGLKEENLEGFLTMKAVLFTKGKGKKDLISNLNGNAYFLINKGTIRKSRVIFKILDFFSLQKIFRQKPPDMSKEGFYFETLGANIIINNGILKTENLIMKSPVFNAVAQGTLDLERKRLDFDLGTQPLGTIDLLVSKIPIVGYILTGEGKSLIVYYFKVRGPLPEPEVEYVPLKHLGNSAMGFLKRLFLTPARLLEELSKVANGFQVEGTPLPEEKF